MNVKEALSRISGIIASYPGDRKVMILLQKNGKRVMASQKVRPCSSLYAELHSVTGEEVTE